MREAWLKANTRLSTISYMVGALMLLAASGFLIAGARSHVVYLVPALLNIVAGGGLCYLGWRFRRPRIAYQSGELLIDLGDLKPVIVPLAGVECFLMGRAASFLPGKQHADTETVTFVVRLRENEPELEHREIDRRIGTWCGHHITLRGTWCEPLSIELANRLNARLAEEQKRSRPRKAS